MPELSIVIVNYKNQHLITQCVQSILDCEQLISYEIIVVDNFSQDDSELLLKAMCPSLRWFQMGYNSGFGRANNVGILAATGNYLLLLNSDVIVQHQDTLNSCVEYLKQLATSRYTILGTRLVNPDGSFQETLRLTFPGIKREIQANPLFIFFVERILNRENKDTDKEQQRQAHYRSGKVAWINGAFLLMNRAIAQEKKLLFDEDFFLYGEDVEWCWRARKQGMNFHHWHEQELVHIGSASMPSFGIKRSQIIVSDWMYLKKTRGFAYFWITLKLTSWSLRLNDWLHHRALKNGRFISQEATDEIKFSRLYVYLVRTYGSLILKNKKLSTEQVFFTNCYEDKKILEAHK